MDEKTCKKCSVLKPLSDFYKHSKMADGHVNFCKECQKSANRQNRAEKVDYYRLYDKERNALPHRVEARKAYFQTESGKESKKKSTQKYRSNHPNKYAAHTAVNNALKSGKLQKQPCCICGNKDSEAHHEDYDLPLEVIWYCDFHHKERHRQLDS